MKERVRFAQIVSAIAVLALAILLSNSANTQEAKNSALMGPGAASCAQFGEEYKKSQSIAETYFYSWAQGFLSGLNFATLAQKRVSTNFELWDGDRQEQHIRIYCANNPLRDYVDAVTDLFVAIRKAQGLPDSGLGPDD